MRIKNNLDYDVTIDFYSLDEGKEFPEFITSLFLLPEDETDISPEELGELDIIALFHTYKGIDVRLLEGGSKMFKPENSKVIELLNCYLPADPRERITNNLKIDANLWYNPPVCVISEKTRC